jgi:hypothetical protein
MTGLFEPVPVVKQFPWINAVMQTFPESFVARMAPDVGAFSGLKRPVKKDVTNMNLYPTKSRPSMTKSLQ